MIQSSLVGGSVLDKQFLIVECPRCSTAQVVDGRFKTRSCASCGKRFQLLGLRVLGRGKNAREARDVVAGIKARLAGRN